MRRVVELFAGVGGFRIGLNDAKLKKQKVIEKNNFDFVFFNQWEPGTSVQSAFNCYMKRFNHDFNVLHNTDITKIDKSLIPNHDLLVGGFPCQDYSIARPLKGEQGIKGKKGVLWWEIHKILEVKKPNFVLLENVDRLLISPSTQRGRDFAIMLKCFDDLGYFVEWKVIRASDYGMPQKRKRVFIFACKKTTKLFEHDIFPNIKNWLKASDNKTDVNIFFSKEFKFKAINNNHLPIEFEKSIQEISDSSSCTFYDSGFTFEKKIYTAKTTPIYDGDKTLLKDIILPENEVSDDLFINDLDKLKKFEFLKDRKKIMRIKDGYKYYYSEGKMSFPDNLDLPGRTMLTSEGQINRSTHIIGCSDNKYRLLSSKECERLNMFPDDWTNVDDISERKRKFLMGNALVCGIIKKMSKHLQKAIDMEKN